MNKRLLLHLYDRSGLAAYMPVDYKRHELQVEEHMEKFAELIVRECCNIVADAVDHREPASTYVEKIEQHFGVEE